MRLRESTVFAASDLGQHCFTSNLFTSLYYSAVCDLGLHCFTSHLFTSLYSSSVSDLGLHCFTSHLFTSLYRSVVSDLGLHCFTSHCFLAAECSQSTKINCDNDGFVDEHCKCYCPDVLEGDRCEEIAKDLTNTGETK